MSEPLPTPAVPTSKPASPTQRTITTSKVDDDPAAAARIKRAKEIRSEMSRATMMPVSWFQAMAKKAEELESDSKLDVSIEHTDLLPVIGGPILFDDPAYQFVYQGMTLRLPQDHDDIALVLQKHEEILAELNRYKADRADMAAKMAVELEQAKEDYRSAHGAYLRSHLRAATEERDMWRRDAKTLRTHMTDKKLKLLYEDGKPEDVLKASQRKRKLAPSPSSSSSSSSSGEESSVEVIATSEPDAKRARHE